MYQTNPFLYTELIVDILKKNMFENIFDNNILKEILKNFDLNHDKCFYDDNKADRCLPLTIYDYGDDWFLPTSIVPLCENCIEKLIIKEDHIFSIKTLTTQLKKRFKFSAAHFLPNYQGNCKNLHGHDYYVDILFGGPIHPDTGMLLDFKYISDTVNKVLKENFHKKLLNDLLINPTAEYTTILIWQLLMTTEIKFIRSIELFESDNSSVKIDADDLANEINILVTGKCNECITSHYDLE